MDTIYDHRASYFVQIDHPTHLPADFKLKITQKLRTEHLRDFSECIADFLFGALGVCGVGVLEGVVDAVSQTGKGWADLICIAADSLTSPTVSND